MPPDHIRQWAVVHPQKSQWWRRHRDQRRRHRRTDTFRLARGQQDRREHRPPPKSLGLQLERTSHPIRRGHQAIPSDRRHSSRRDAAPIRLDRCAEGSGIRRGGNLPCAVLSSAAASGRWICAVGDSPWWCNRCGLPVAPGFWLVASGARSSSGLTRATFRGLVVPRGCDLRWCGGGGSFGV